MLCCRLIDLQTVVAQALDTLDAYAQSAADALSAAAAKTAEAAAAAVHAVRGAVGSSFAQVHSGGSSEIMPAEEQPARESGGSSSCAAPTIKGGKMRKLQPELAKAPQDPSDARGGWVPADVALPGSWRAWLEQNQTTLAVAGLGAASVAAAAFLVFGGRTHR